MALVSAFVLKATGAALHAVRRVIGCMGHEGRRSVGRIQTLSITAPTVTVAGSSASRVTAAESSSRPRRPSYQRIGGAGSSFERTPRELGPSRRSSFATSVSDSHALPTTREEPEQAPDVTKEGAAAKAAQARDAAASSPAAVDVGGCSECGAKQENQDVFDIQRLSPTELYVSVLDGHGAAGGEVARHGTVTLFSYLSQITAGTDAEARIGRKQVRCLQRNKTAIGRSYLAVR